MRAAAREERDERGVYKAWWKIDGCDVLYAVTSTGERLKKIVVIRPGVSEERAFRWFSEVLDRVDPPRPKLALVTDSPRPKQLTVDEIDALYRDADPVNALLWRRKRDRIRASMHGASFRELSRVR